MIRLFLISIICCCLLPVSHSQNHQISVETGYNKIGVFINPHVGIDIHNHQIHLGIKTYGYNLFFETNTIGPQLGYQYVFKSVNKNVFFYPSLSYAMFREEKTNSSLLLSELNLKYGLGINLSNHLALINEVGAGYIMSNSNLFNELKTVKSAYPSFEISLGLVYCFNKSVK